MECAEYDRLESELMEIRERRNQLLFKGEPTDRVGGEIAQAEQLAIMRLSDHRSEHKCKNPGE